METAHKLDAIVLDKTGTITRGEPALTDVLARGELGEEELLRLVASAERRSEHPLAEAIVRGAEERGVDLLQPDEFESVIGKGVRVVLSERSRRRPQDQRRPCGGSLCFVQRSSSSW